MDEEAHAAVEKALALDNAKWWNSRFQAERINEEREIQDAMQRHPSAHERS